MAWRGTPIFGFGLVLVVWLAACGVGAWLLSRRTGWAAALGAYGLTTLVVAAVVALAIPRMFPDGVPIRGYGVMVLAGATLGMMMSLHLADRANLSRDVIFSFAVEMFLCGVIGARLLYVIEYWDVAIRRPTLAATLVEALKFTEGGLVVYGGFFGVIASFLWFVYRKKIPAFALADILAPSLLAGVALGRIGCFLNGCCYGGETDRPWAVTFPRYNSPQSLSPPYADQAAAGRFYGLRIAEGEDSGGAGRVVALDRVEPGSPAEEAGLHVGDRVRAINGRDIGSLDDARATIYAAVFDAAPLELTLADGGVRTLAAIDPPPRSRPVHPVQLYSSIDAGLLAWLLWSYYPFRRREGEVTALMLTVHPVSRFLQEIVRVDESAIFGTGMTIAQNVSLALLAAAALLWVYLLRKPAGKLDFPLPASPAPAN
jgi:phosphatidylglycerol:prolipoprotein diacylglycerol transferase